MIESFLFVIALSIDAFTSSFAYGTNKIKIPFKSAMVINLVCSLFLTLSIFLGTFLHPYIAEETTNIISFVILFILGLVKYFDSTIKMLIKKQNQVNKEFTFSIFNLQFMLNIYANPQTADIDASKRLSPKEALYLGTALAVDGLAVGLGAGLTNTNHLLVILFSLVSDIIAIITGGYIGNKIAEKTSLNLSWLSGVILMFLALTKL